MNNHLTEWIQPQMLRAPEVILGAEWNSKVDIWNVGLVVSAHPLFRPNRLWCTNTASRFGSLPKDRSSSMERGRQRPRIQQKPI